MSDSEYNAQSTDAMFSTILAKIDGLHGTVSDIRDEQRTVAADLKSQLVAQSAERMAQLSHVHARIDETNKDLGNIKGRLDLATGKVIGGIAVGTALSGVLGWLGSKYLGK